MTIVKLKQGDKVWIGVYSSPAYELSIHVFFLLKTLNKAPGDDMFSVSTLKLKSSLIFTFHLTVES